MKIIYIHMHDRLYRAPYPSTQQKKEKSKYVNLNE